MNTVTNTERPKLQLNLAAKPLTLDTNATSLVPSLTPKKVVVFEKSDIATTKVGKDDSKAGKSKTNNIPDVSCKKDAATDAPKAKNKDTKKSKKQLKRQQGSKSRRNHERED